MAGSAEGLQVAGHEAQVGPLADGYDVIYLRGDTLGDGEVGAFLTALIGGVDGEDERAEPVLDGIVAALGAAGTGLVCSAGLTVLGAPTGVYEGGTAWAEAGALDDGWHLAAGYQGMTLRSMR